MTEGGESLQTNGPVDIGEALRSQIADNLERPDFLKRQKVAKELIKKDPEMAASLMALYQEQALTDTLTGLGNRRAFENDLVVRISRAKRQFSKDGGSMPFVLMLVDADGLKQVNDDKEKGGHDAGDRYLKAIADTLNNVRETEGVYRLGGDEFAVILEDTTHEGALVVVERFLSTFNQIRTERNLPLHTGLSIGVAQSGSNPDPLELYKRADEALYGVKYSKKKQA